jgi:hypothetical protein
MKRADYSGGGRLFRFSCAGVLTGCGALNNKRHLPFVKADAF